MDIHRIVRHQVHFESGLQLVARVVQRLPAVTALDCDHIISSFRIFFRVCKGKCYKICINDLHGMFIFYEANPTTSELMYM
jgi:hypothetical protein